MYLRQAFGRDREDRLGRARVHVDGGALRRRDVSTSSSRHSSMSSSRHSSMSSSMSSSRSSSRSTSSTSSSSTSSSSILTCRSAGILAQVKLRPKLLLVASHLTVGPPAPDNPYVNSRSRDPYVNSRSADPYENIRSSDPYVPRPVLVFVALGCGKRVATLLVHSAPLLS